MAAAFNLKRKGGGLLPLPLWGFTWGKQRAPGLARGPKDSAEFLKGQRAEGSTEWAGQSGLFPSPKTRNE